MPVGAGAGAGAELSRSDDDPYRVDPAWGQSLKASLTSSPTFFTDA